MNRFTVIVQDYNALHKPSPAFSGLVVVGSFEENQENFLQIVTRSVSEGICCGPSLTLRVTVRSLQTDHCQRLRKTQSLRLPEIPGLAEGENCAKGEEIGVLTSFSRNVLGMGDRSVCLLSQLPRQFCIPEMQPFSRSDARHRAPDVR
jgi:hypothetical protein